MPDSQTIAKFSEKICSILSDSKKDIKKRPLELSAKTELLQNEILAAFSLSGRHDEVISLLVSAPSN